MQNLKNRDKKICSYNLKQGHIAIAPLRKYKELVTSWILRELESNFNSRDQTSFARSDKYFNKKNHPTIQ